MEELTIEIECLEIKKQEIQNAISKPFQYERSPGDNEFYELLPLLSELAVVQGKIDVLEEVRHSVITNRTA